MMSPETFDGTTMVMVTCEASSRKQKKLHGIKMCDDGRCPVEGCDYICKNKKESTFAMHVTMCHQVLVGNSPSTYTCLDCNRTFKSRSILNNHRQTAHRPWEFKCREPGCDKKCPNKAGLLTHHVAKHLRMKDINCVDENGCCVNCAEKLPKTGHKYHYAKCIGLDRKLFE